MNFVVCLAKWIIYVSFLHCENSVNAGLYSFVYLYRIWRIQETKGRRSAAEIQEAIRDGKIVGVRRTKPSNPTTTTHINRPPPLPPPAPFQLHHPKQKKSPTDLPKKQHRKPPFPTHTISTICRIQNAISTNPFTKNLSLLTEPPTQETPLPAALPFVGNSRNRECRSTADPSRRRINRYSTC